MKVANSCSAGEVSVRLCFLVNVLKASGLRVAGGRRMGRIVAFVGATENGFSEWVGVANAGDDEGIGFEALEFEFLAANIDAA
jgi:hypothetical protein